MSRFDKDTQIGLAKYLLIILVISVVPIFAFSQEILKIEDVISIGLKNNFDIQIAANESNINKVNNTAGNAGQYPNIGLGLGTSYSLNSTHQEYSSGSIIDKNSASLQIYSASLNLNWTIFNGFRMFTTKQKLEEIERLGEIKFHQQIQSSIAQFIIAFYDVVKQKQQLNTVLEVKSLSAERMKLGEIRFNSGVSSKTELLQSQIDYNTQCQNEINQLNAISESKRKLNQLINRDILIDFDTDNKIPYTDIDSIEAIKKIIVNNPSIQNLNKQLEISELTIKETESLNYPQIDLSAGYLYNLNQNKASLVNYNRTIGPQIGLNLSYPIYQAGNISRQTQSAKLSYKSLEYQLESLKTQAYLQFQNSYNQYITQKRLLKIEEQTSEIAKENVMISIERLKLSQTTPIEVRDAQLSYENSRTRLTNIYYNLKIAETQIKLLMGDLQK